MNNKYYLDDLAAVSDLAKLFGVTMSAVINWHNRHDDFPEPLGLIGNRPVWYLPDVLAWQASKENARHEAKIRKIARLESELARMREN